MQITIGLVAAFFVLLAAFYGVAWFMLFLIRRHIGDPNRALQIELESTREMSREKFARMIGL